MADRDMPGASSEGLEARLDHLAALIAAAPLNLVSDRDRARVRTRHVDEAVAVALALEGAPGERWLDLGTGGGLPGLVLAMVHPDVHVTLLDSVAKKTRVVAGFAEQLGLGNIQVVAERAESLAHRREYRGAFDGVVARAVAPLVVLVELARGFVRPGGLLVAVKGPASRLELEEASWAIEQLRWTDVHSRSLGSTARQTSLVTMRATGPVPAGVPRGVGVPRRRPLRGC